MFNVTSDLLKSILILRSSEQTRGAWIMFVQELRKIRDQHVSENLHFVPSTDDINARYRKDIMNGIAICMDVLTHSLEDPDSLLESIRKMEEQVATNLNTSPF
jgi:hypothetical protein